MTVSAVGPASTGPETLRPSGGEHDDRVRRRLDGLVEPERDLGRRRVDPALLARDAASFSVAWADAAAGTTSASEDGGEDGTPSHGLPPASSERCPKIGATSRSENSITATATNVSANPYDHSARRGRKRRAEREHRGDDERPADQVVEERGAGEQPARSARARGTRRRR